jgi:hypothetical protein
MSDMPELKVQAYQTLQCWRIHIPGVSDGKGVTSDAKFTSTAKCGLAGGPDGPPE